MTEVSRMRVASVYVLVQRDLCNLVLLLNLSRARLLARSTIRKGAHCGRNRADSK